MNMAEKTLEAALSVLGWSSLKCALDAVRGDFWAADGWNLSAARRDDGTITGGCGYGSSIVIYPDGSWRVESCGGHWVAWDWNWWVDSRDSHASWGDSELGLPEHELIRQRCRRLDVALAEQKAAV